MNYESGLSLSQLLKRNPQPDEELLTRILMPLLDGLHAVHETGFLHRDIKPSNLFIRDSGQPVLLDFGSARVATGETTRTVTSVLTPGYAPLEQYSKDGNQGPWTDIYSLAAVLFRAVVGDNPPDVVTRLKDDSVMQILGAARDRFSQRFLNAINHGIQVDEKKRPQTVPEWKAMFGVESQVTPQPESEITTVIAEPQAPQVEKFSDATTVRPGNRRVSMKQMTAYAAGAIVLFLVIGGAEMFDRFTGRNVQADAVSAGKGGRESPGRLTPREFYLLDRDRSGFLTQDEVRGDAVIEQNFRKLDRNRDGRLSLEEFIASP
jgi:serine/threonine protein kinase